MIIWAELDLLRLVYTPAPNGNGDPYTTFNFKVNDGEVDSQFYVMTTVVCGVNDRPTVAAGIPDQSATVNTEYEYTFPEETFFDLDGSTLTYSAALSGGGALPGWLSFDADDREFSGMPQAGDVGTLTVRGTATESGVGGASVSETYVITVSATANSGPTAQDKTVSTTEDRNYTFGASDFSFDDIDTGDTLASVKIITPPASGRGSLTLNGVAVSTDRAVAKADIDADRLKYPPPADANGSAYASFTFRVSNGKANSVDAYTITIKVTAVNGPPTVANPIPDQGRQWARGSATGRHLQGLDGDTLSYTTTKADGGALCGTWLSFSPGSRTLSGRPQSGDVGRLMVKVTATDTSNATASDTFVITVGTSHNPPTVTNAIPNQTATASTLFSYAFPANTPKDQDAGQTLTYTAALDNGNALPAWLNFTPGTRTFSGTPGSTDAGTLMVKVTATDTGDAATSDTFNIVVGTAAPTNNPPRVANPIPNQTASAGTRFSYTFPANTFSDSDAGDSLSYLATKADGTALPAWLTFTPGTRTFSGTPRAGHVGTLMVKVTATDGDRASVSDNLNITVSGSTVQPSHRPGAGTTRPASPRARARAAA